MQPTLVVVLIFKIVIVRVELKVWGVTVSQEVPFLCVIENTTPMSLFTLIWQDESLPPSAGK